MNGRLFGQWVEVLGHHEGYISREEFEENLRILARNAHTPRHSTLGRGPALVQGLVRCVRHDEHVMSVAYAASASKRAKSYQLRCMGDLLSGGPACISMPGLAFEARVAELLLDHLQGPSIPEVRRLWEERRRQQRRAGTRHQHELRRLREEFDRLGALYATCRPDRRRVREMLESQIEALAERVEQMERGGAAAGEDRIGDDFSDEKWREVEAICGDVRAIWFAPTTQARDQKELLRIAVQAILIEGRDRERIWGRIHWEDGARETSFEVLLPAYFHREMRALADAGLTPVEIAARFDAVGGRTQQGNPWSASTVERTLGVLRKKRSG